MVLESEEAVTYLSRCAIWAETLHLDGIDCLGPLGNGVLAWLSERFVSLASSEHLFFRSKATPPFSKNVFCQP